MTICILGRQPKIGLAELEAAFGNDAVRPLGPEAALVEIAPTLVNHSYLGGTIKVARLLTILPTTQWSKVLQYVHSEFPRHFDHLPPGKVTFGLSTYGIQATPHQLTRAGLELKKSVRATGRSVRTIPNPRQTLNSAQVMHNNLLGTLGMELLFISDGRQTYLAQTTSVQDVESYSRRDFSRPKRDAFVGMLPPKLAQIMLNLAKPATQATILDPFCGTGVVLLEAALRGFAVEGSDLNQKMVEYTRTNLQWLGETYHFTPQVKEITRADATEHEWRKTIDAVVSEVYLGQPLSGLPSPQKLAEIMRNCDTIIRKFLQNLHHQLKPGVRCCLAVPAWKTQKGFSHLPLLDDLEKLGYNRVSFSYVQPEDLVYHRPDQIVARELLILTRK